MYNNRSKKITEVLILLIIAYAAAMTIYYGVIYWDDIGSIYNNFMNKDSDKSESISAQNIINNSDTIAVSDTTDIFSVTETSATIEIAKTYKTPENSKPTETTKITQTTETSKTSETSATLSIPATKTQIPLTTEPPPVTKSPVTTAKPKPTPAPSTTSAPAAATSTPPSTASYTSSVSPTPTSMIPYINPADYSDVPKSDFLQKMFENAFDIPGSANKNKVEQPPKGRNAELQSKIVPLINDVSKMPEPAEYFKNIVFLGDSVTLGFDLFKSKITFNGENVLKDVGVIASGSYGVYNAAREISKTSIHPLYNGKQMLPEDIIAKKDAKIVFICLGLNDVSLAPAEVYVSVYSDLIGRIKAKNPDKTVVIMSVTPVVAGVKKNLTNEKIMNANNALIEYASENNIPFIDYAAAIRDENNNLYETLASDGFCHLTIEAYNRLVEYILYHPITINDLS